MRDNSKPLYAFDKRNPSKCKFSDFQLLAWKLTKFLMSFFKARISFPLNFASPFSVMAQNSSDISSWIIKLWTKGAHQSTNFETFVYFNESSPVPLLTPSRKGTSFPFSLAKKVIYLDTQMEGEFTDLFWNYQGVPCYHRQSRNRMMKTFITL